MQEYLGYNIAGSICPAVDTRDAIVLWAHCREQYPFLMLFLGAVRGAVEPTFTVLPQTYFSLNRLPPIRAASSLSFMNYRIMALQH